nr:pyruvate, phosphate dikinase regulatory protein, chloroplastic [Tanacetum cinerariifolium]
WELSSSSGNFFWQWEHITGSGKTTLEVGMDRTFNSQQECYKTLLQQYHSLEKHCISLEEKDTVILKLKEKIKSFSGDDKERKPKRQVEEIETHNLELDHKVTKLVAENEHLKQTYKQLFDSIKPSPVQSKEQCDDLINKVNLAHIDYIRHTQEEEATLRELVESERLLSLLNTSLAYACK